MTRGQSIRRRRAVGLRAAAASVVGVCATIAVAAAAEQPISRAEKASASEAAARTASLAPPIMAAEPAIVAPKPRLLSPYQAALATALEEAEPSMQAAYDAVSYQPIWGRVGKRGAPQDWSRARALISALDAAPYHALPKARYQVDALADRLAVVLDRRPLERRAPFGLAEAAELERALSEAFVLFGGDLAAGVVDPMAEISNIFLETKRPDPAVMLAKLQLAAHDPAAVSQQLNAYAPQGRDYRALMGAYARFTQRAAAGDYGPAHRHRRTLKQGVSGADVASARDRLEALGYLLETTGAAPVDRRGRPLFDAAMDAAVKRFQAENGLLTDGQIGPATATTLNRSAAERARQIAVNLERSRWHNFDLGARHVRVNIPDYHMDVMENGRSIFRSRVVVGKPKHATPEFSDQMSHIVVNPKWHVPRSIATKELLPEIQTDPGVLQQKNMRLIGAGGVTVDPWMVDWTQITRANFPFRIQQASGDWNALGDVKFIFPNRHAIYLHDTPSKRLFNRSMRAFSHGCVRVQRPKELAELLLSAQRPADAAQYYRRLRRAGSERYVPLQRELPVHLLYRTAWVDESGVLQSRPDIYGRDQRVAAALENAGVVLP